MRFFDIRKTVIKSGDAYVDQEVLIGLAQADFEADNVHATPRWVALKPTSPERFRPSHNRSSRRTKPFGRSGRFNLNGFEPHWRRNG